METKISRRRALLFGADAACSFGAAAGLVALPSRAASARRFVVLSLIGNRLEVIGAANVTGTRLDRNTRMDVPDSELTFDAVAAAAAAEAIEKAESGAKASVLRMGASRFHDEPEALLQADGVALPGAAVDAIERQRATHLVLVTKYAGDAAFKLADTIIGNGRLRGVGYYEDRSTSLVSTATGSHGDGFVSPFVYARVSLVDVQTGKVVKDTLIRATEVIPFLAERSGSSPWHMMSGAEKVERLSEMLRREVRRAVDRVLGPG